MQVNNNITFVMPQVSFFSALGKSISHFSKQAFYDLSALFAKRRSSFERKCRLLSKYHNWGSHILASKLYFGKHFVAPSINMEAKDTLTEPTDLNRQTKILQKAKNLAANSIQFDEQAIPDKKSKKGVYLGASLKFSEIFLRKLNKGLTADQAFAKAAVKFTQGVSRKTCLKASLQKAVDLSQVSVKFEATGKNLTQHDKTIIYNRKREQAVANLFNLTVHKAAAVIERQNLKTQFQDLADGCYKMGMYPHSTFLYKENGQVYFYDPTYGSAAMPTDRCIKMLSRLTRFTGVKTFEFTPVELKQNILSLSGLRSEYEDDSDIKED